MRSFGGHCDRRLVWTEANTFQRVAPALSMAGAVVSASFWRVDVHSTVLPTRDMRHWILSGLGALP